MSSVAIREITAAETWPLRHEVMWPDKPFTYVQLPDDDQGHHYGVFENDRLVSVISLFINGDLARFRKFATLPACQRQGYGSRLLSHVMTQAHALGATRIWCSARVEAAPFYEKFGMREVGDRFPYEGMPYVRMEMTFGSGSS
jgi:GNAT superfamily N-acetyltransferase